MSPGFLDFLFLSGPLYGGPKPGVAVRAWIFLGGAVRKFCAEANHTVKPEHVSFTYLD
jgi:hypothetical protein